MPITPPFFFYLIILLITSPPPSTASFLAEPLTVPAAPVAALSPSSCRLDLSAELFGGVAAACGGNDLDRGRCCPVLAAWLYAAHARSALHVSPAPEQHSGEEFPVMPDDPGRCAGSLAAALEAREVRIPRPNATCDPILCFCGIRLHRIGSLSCSAAAFNVSRGGRMAAPTEAVRSLEGSCRNSSYNGCTRCLGALNKVKGDSGRNKSGGGERASSMFDRDCQLMGLTWLLAKNKTMYIPTVSAVLRAIMYSSSSNREASCSPDQENMPLAVDSLQLDNDADHRIANWFSSLITFALLLALY